ncbi:MAG TPA: protein kinase [Ktedonobacterales bacterium]|nr:protein kinase [Ktedonobacterales bacterium]
MAKDDGEPQPPSMDSAQVSALAHEVMVTRAAETQGAPWGPLNPLSMLAAPAALGMAAALNQRSSRALADAQALPSTFGPYVFLRRLGGGALGEVYLAAPLATVSQHTQPAPPAQRALTSLVAIKLLYAPASDPAAQEIAHRTRQMTTLRHARIIPLHELITLQNRLGLVMGFAPRGSLGDALNRRDGRRLVLPLGAHVVAQVIAQVGQALTALHAAGLAHGDLTPNNIFIRSRTDGAPNVAIGDVGQGAIAPAIAQALEHEIPHTDELRAWVALQRRFAAPERVVTGATPATDQYALAALAYFLLTGSTPAAALTTAAGDANVPILPPSHRNPQLPAAADAVVLRGLAPEPDERFPSVAVFTHELAATLLPARTLATRASVSRDEQSSRRVKARAQPTRSTSLRRPLILATVLAVLLALCVVSVGVYAFSGIGAYHPPGSINLSDDSGPTVTPTPTLSPGERLAIATATTLQGGTPVFSDALDGSSHRWATTTTANGRVFYGADGRLDLSDAGSGALTEDDPSHTMQGDALVQVEISFIAGNASDLAGLRFFVTQNSDKTSSYLAYLITANGHYALWLNQHGQRSTLVSGYTTVLVTGLNQTNTLAALADGPDGEVTLFANGQVIAQVYLPTDYAGPTSGAFGLIAVSKGVDVAYARYAVYAGVSLAPTP